MNTYLRLLTACGIGLLASCANIPNKISMPDPEVIESQMRQARNAIPPVSIFPGKMGFHIIRHGALPDHLKDIQVSLRLNAGSTVRDLVYTLGSQGIPLIVANKEIGEREIFLTAYEGNLKSLVSALELSLNAAFAWSDGTLMIDNTRSYAITMPQDKVLMEETVNELGSLGGENISTSIGAGMVTYSATPRRQQAIEAYLKRMSSNSAMVKMEVAILNMSTDTTRKQGFDWSSLDIKLGDQDSSSSGTAPAIEGGESTTASGPTEKLLATFNGSGIAAKLVRGELDFTSFVAMLSTYSNSQTTQNLILKTLAGKTVKVISEQKIPFVSKVNVVASSNENDTLVTGGADTDFVESGLNIDLTPLYDAQGKLVTIEVNLKLSSFLGFVDLSAGNQIGTLTQPKTQSQSFNDTLRLRAGEIAVIGGLIYESVSDNRNAPRGLERMNVAYQNQQTIRNALYIVLRPTVTVYDESIPE